MWLVVLHTHQSTIECSITTNFKLSEILSTSLCFSWYLIPSCVAFLMIHPHVHGTSTASVASEGFASASEGSTAGTLEASWGARTERWYVGSQDKVGERKNFIQKIVIVLYCSINQPMQFRGFYFWDTPMLCFKNSGLQVLALVTSMFQNWNESCESIIQVWLKHAKTSWSSTLFSQKISKPLPFQSI